MKGLSLLAVCIVLFLPGSGYAQSIIESPRIRALHEQIEKKTPGAVEQFWADVAKTGTPLIERATENELHSLVTFLWKGDATTKHVLPHSYVRNILLNWPRRSTA